MNFVFFVCLFCFIWIFKISYSINKQKHSKIFRNVFSFLLQMIVFIANIPFHIVLWCYMAYNNDDNSYSIVDWYWSLTKLYEWRISHSFQNKTTKKMNIVHTETTDNEHFCHNAHKIQHWKPNLRMPIYFAILFYFVFLRHDILIDSPFIHFFFIHFISHRSQLNEKS